MANIPFDQVLAEELADPETRAHYDAMGPAFAIADAIIKARIARKLTQEQLATRMGAKQPFVAKLESGYQLPTLKTLARIATATETELVVNLKPKRLKRARDKVAA